jgi:hypothetical protein
VAGLCYIMSKPKLLPFSTLSPILWFNITAAASVWSSVGCRYQVRAAENFQ